MVEKDDYAVEEREVKQPLCISGSTTDVSESQPLFLRSPEGELCQNGLIKFSVTLGGGVPPGVFIAIDVS